MYVFRSQRKSNELLHPAEYTKGRIAWGADTIDGKRTKQVCTGNGMQCIPLDEYRRMKEERKARNIRLNMPNVRKSRRAELLNGSAGLQPLLDT